MLRLGPICIAWSSEWDRLQTVYKAAQSYFRVVRAIVKPFADGGHKSLSFQAGCDQHCAALETLRDAVEAVEGR